MVKGEIIDIRKLRCIFYLVLEMSLNLFEKRVRYEVGDLFMMGIFFKKVIYYFFKRCYYYNFLSSYRNIKIF